jgi:ribosomal protein S18 acetylase RimI-like enzyme
MVTNTEASLSVWAHERGILWAKDIGGEPLLPTQPRFPATFGEVRQENVKALASAMGLPNPNSALHRLNTQRRCFIARTADTIVAYGWLSQGVECIGEHEREIHLQPTEAYVWDCATLPAYRGQRLYSALLSHIAVRCQAEGVRRLWIGTALDNQPSLKGFTNAGFRPVLTLIYTRLLTLRCTWFSGHPMAQREQVAAARRALLLDHEYAWGPLGVRLGSPASLITCAQPES